MKHPDLCQRAYCRVPWAWVVGAYEPRARRSWMLRVCDVHVEPYRDARGDPARSITVKKASDCETEKSAKSAKVR